MNASIVSKGFCGYTEESNVNDCRSGAKGRWSLTESQAATMALAQAACITQCSQCMRCRFISYSARWRECSWFHLCHRWPDKLLTQVDGFGSMFLGHKTPAATLVVLVGSLRGGEAAWQSLIRNLLQPNRADLALSLGRKVGKPSESSILLSYARYVWWVDDEDDWGVYFDELANSTAWRHVVARVRKQHGLGIAGHCGLGGVILDGQRIGGTAGINFALRWWAAIRFQALRLQRRYQQLVVTRTDHYYPCRLEIEQLLLDSAYSLDDRWVFVPSGSDWYGLNDRFILCSKKMMINCLNLISPILLEPSMHKEAIPMSGEGYNLYLLRYFQATVIRFPRSMFLVGELNDSKQNAWSHAPSTAADEAFGLHVKYSDEYRSALKTCFRDRDTLDLTVRAR